MHNSHILIFPDVLREIICESYRAASGCGSFLFVKYYTSVMDFKTKTDSGLIIYIYRVVKILIAACAIAGKYTRRCTIPILIIYSLYRRTKRSPRRLSRYLSRRRYVERLRYCGTVTLTRREHIFAACESRMKTGPPRIVNARRRISSIKHTAHKV